jgi:hypothetical protein
MLAEYGPVTARLFSPAELGQGESVLARPGPGGLLEMCTLTSDYTFPTALPVPVEQGLILLVPAATSSCNHKGRPEWTGLVRPLQGESCRAERRTERPCLAVSGRALFWVRI